jgi:ABC-2 type transport system ATP-binding protein
MYEQPIYHQSSVPTVICENLTKTYGNICALNHIHLQLPAGRIIGLLGPNGSGKTTLIKILTGILQPTEGEAKICGISIGAETKAVVSYLPDKMYYAPWMKAKDLLDMFQDFYPDFRRDRAEAMCAGLSIPMDMKIKNMSKGTQEKLQLIVTMARRARLYLLDEPIAGVDPAAREFILQTIMSNLEPESTVLISTHLILDVEPILHEAVFLRQGNIVCYDSVENIRVREGKSLDELFREIFRMPVNYGGMYYGNMNYGGPGTC